MAFISRPPRSTAPITPRIVLIGPVGSGRKTQAKALAKKYNIVESKKSLLNILNGNFYLIKFYKIKSINI